MTSPTIQPTSTTAASNRRSLISPPGPVQTHGSPGTLYLHPATLRLRLVLLILVPQIQPKLRRPLRSCHLHRNLSTRTVLLEERVHRLQQQRLPFGSHHLRQLGVCPHLSAEVELIAIK